MEDIVGFLARVSDLAVGRGVSKEPERPAQKLPCAGLFVVGQVPEKAAISPLARHLSVDGQQAVNESSPNNPVGWFNGGECAHPFFDMHEPRSNGGVVLLVLPEVTDSGREARVQQPRTPRFDSLRHSGQVVLPQIRDVPVGKVGLALSMSYPQEIEVATEVCKPGLDDRLQAIGDCQCGRDSEFDLRCRDAFFGCGSDAFDTGDQSRQISVNLEAEHRRIIAERVLLVLLQSANLSIALQRKPTGS